MSSDAASKLRTYAPREIRLVDPGRVDLQRRRTAGAVPEPAGDGADVDAGRD